VELTAINDDCSPITSLEPDRRFLAIFCTDQPTRVWDTAQDRLVAELPSVTQVRGRFRTTYPAVSAAGDRAAIARGNDVKVYELPGARLLRTIKHGAPIHVVAFAATWARHRQRSHRRSVIVTRDNGTLNDAADLASWHRHSGVPPRRPSRRGGCWTASADLRLGERRLLTSRLEHCVGTLRMSSDGHRLVTVTIFRARSPRRSCGTRSAMPVAQLASRGEGQVYSARFVARGEVITAAATALSASGMGTPASSVRPTRWLALSRRCQLSAMAPCSSAAVAMVSCDSGRPPRDVRCDDAGRMLPSHRVHFEGADIVTRRIFGRYCAMGLARPEQVIEACDRMRVRYRTG